MGATAVNPLCTYNDGRGVSSLLRDPLFAGKFPLPKCSLGPTASVAGRGAVAYHKLAVEGPPFHLLLSSFARLLWCTPQQTRLKRGMGLKMPGNEPVLGFKQATGHPRACMCLHASLRIPRVPALGWAVPKLCGSQVRLGALEPGSVGL